MKLLIASDLHGSYYYCEKLIERFFEEKADRLILCGDILYHGPRNDLPKDYNPKLTAKALNGIKNKIICVRGNCDAEVDQNMLEFPLLAENAIVCTEEKVLFITHGHKFSVDNPPPVNNGDIVVGGHTHVPLFVEKNGVFYVNPGSVSIPKENSHHGYIIFENAAFIMKDIEGNEIKKYFV